MIKIIAIVDSLKQYDFPIQEFQKRLGKKVEFTKLKPSKKDSKSEVIKDETQKLFEVLEKEKGYKVLLFINTKEKTSPEFEKFLSQKQMNFGDVIFIIGGAYGIDIEKISQLIDEKISFSKMTFPHGLALLLLYEQLYRADCIKIGKKYHH